MARATTPPPLAVPPPQRRSSTDSASSSSSSSPTTPIHDSSSALILVHDETEDAHAPFDFSSDEDEDDGPPLQFQAQRKMLCPPLGPWPVFVYLVAPFAKLGALILPRLRLPLKHALTALLLCAAATAFARQIWYMLTRYMRKVDMEDVIVDAFARSRSKERLRGFLRFVVRAGTATVRVLLATVYLYESVNVLLPLLPTSSKIPIRPLLTVALALLIFPISIARNLAYKRALYSTYLSLIAYLAWFGCIASLHTTGTLGPRVSDPSLGKLWNGIAVIAFALSTSSTVPLYVSLKGTAPPIATGKPPKFRSFKYLSLLSVVVSLAFTIPLVVFAANDNNKLEGPTALYTSTKVIPLLEAATLLFGIPSIFATTPVVPFPRRLRSLLPSQFSKHILYIVSVALALVPPKASCVLHDVLLALALASTYLLPPLVHVTVHIFKRPLAIVMQHLPSSPMMQSAGESSAGGGGAGGSSGGPDEILLRKERALQKRQFRKRIVWDLGSWLLLFASGVGIVWATRCLIVGS